MWIASKYGYFSIATSELERERYILRSTSYEDLEQIQKAAGLDGWIQDPGDIGYAAQTLMTTAELFRVMNRLGESVDYPLFLNKVSTIPDQQSKRDAYNAVKNIMMQWQRSDTLVLPYVFSIEDDKGETLFQNKRLLAAAEGGGIDVAEGDGVFYAMISEDMSFMEEEDGVAPGSYARRNVMEFPTREARKRYLLRQFRGLIKNWQRRNDWQQQMDEELPW